MSEKKYFKQIHPKGFSLLEIMVAVGIFGVIILAVNEIFLMVKKNERHIMQTNAAFQKKIEIGFLLTSRQNCEANFGFLTPNPFDTTINTPQPTTLYSYDPTTAARSPVYQVGDFYDNNLIELKEINLTGYQSFSNVGPNVHRGIMDFQLVFRKVGTHLGADEIAHMIKLNVELEGYTGGLPAERIKTCTVIGHDTRRLWARNQTGHIIYRGNGKIGIGVPNPSEKVQVNGDVLAGAYLGPSDRRLKEQIRTSAGLNLINRLSAVLYQNREDLKDYFGFIAQEVEPIVPEAVAWDKNQDLKSVDYLQIIGPLIESVKELKAQQVQLTQLRKQNRQAIDRLKAKLEAAP